MRICLAEELYQFVDPSLYALTISYNIISIICDTTCNIMRTSNRIPNVTIVTISEENFDF